MHSQKELYWHIISAPHHDVDTNAESRLRLPSGSECASRKHASKQPHLHAGMRPDVTVVQAPLGPKDAPARSHSNTRDAKPGERGCWSHQIARMQDYATHEEYATALKIS
jgi:hypothetical protein